LLRYVRRRANFSSIIIVIPLKGRMRPLAKRRTSCRKNKKAGDSRRNQAASSGGLHHVSYLSYPFSMACPLRFTGGQFRLPDPVAQSVQFG
jgi:hypothetical protein